MTELRQSLPNGEIYRPFQFTARCNACGLTFSRSVKDANLEGAQANFMTALTLGHGSDYGKFGSPKCTQNSGQDSADYTITEAIDLQPPAL